MVSRTFSINRFVKLPSERSESLQKKDVLDAEVLFWRIFFRSMVFWMVKLVGWVICFTQPTGFILDLHYGLLVTNLICKIPDTQTKLIWSPTMGCLKGLTNQPLLKRIGHQYMSQKSQFLFFSSSFFGLTSTSQGRTVSCDVFSFQVNRISPTLFLDIRVFFLVVGKSPYFFGGCWDKHRHKKHATVYKPKKLPHFHAELLLCFDLHWVLGMLPAIGFENGDGSSVY